MGARSNHIKAFKAKEKKRKERKDDENNKRKETNEEFGARHRTFGVWPHSRDSALVDCLTHHAGGTLLL